MSDALPPARDDPESMFTPEQNYARNQSWAKPGPYVTDLPPSEELAFKLWLRQNRVAFDPTDKNPDYDMRGFYKAFMSKDPRASSAIDPNDQRLHYPDYWKTPYAATFSNESQWATKAAPSWADDKYMLDKHIIYDDAAGKWFGLPAPPSALTQPVPQITVPPVDTTSTAPLKAMPASGP